MKKLFPIALLALPLLAVPAQAICISIPAIKIQGGASLHIGCGPGCCGPAGGCPGGGLGPWYLYWPMEAHFQLPAMPQYPNWPSPQGLPNGPSGAALYSTPPVPSGPPMPAPGYPPAGGYGHSPGGFQPAGYQVPSYWYGQ
jgi:hypothetical protein